jgi:hypothetical protein
LQLQHNYHAVKLPLWRWTWESRWFCQRDQGNANFSFLARP